MDRTALALAAVSLAAAALSHRAAWNISSIQTALVVVSLAAAGLGILAGALGRRWKIGVSVNLGALLAGVASFLWISFTNSE